MEGDISAVIPARNEAATIANVVLTIEQHPAIKEVIVVDNASTDETAVVAKKAGARVIQCPQIGLGRAMKAGVKAAQSRYILRSDGDIQNWQPMWIDRLLPTYPHCLSRGIYKSPYNQLPMSNYVVRPFLHLYRPAWEVVPIPTTGTYLLDRYDHDWEALPDNWSIDIAILFGSMSNHPELVKNVEIGTLSDKQRGVAHYIPMATDLTEYLVSFFAEDILKR
ncbi:MULTISPECIES: glycosyltransferase [Kordiimonas]|uniref:glycosyltransferase n=1 Tax=Kordiimonas TaxID=288021 RepID=UPI00257B8265|nr:glycosyltransferase [Kordiimonas sp. UBA4487]